MVHQLRHLRHPASAILLSCVFLNACGSDDPTRTEPRHSVAVSVATTGEDPDPDGYTIRLGADEREVGPSGSVSFDNLPPGSYEVILDGIAANCSAEDGPSATVTVTETGGGAVSFGVVCASILETGTFAVVQCPGLSVPVGSARPMTLLEIGTLPPSFEPPLFAHALWEGGGTSEVAMSFVHRSDDGSVTMVVPYHPSGDLDGGNVTLRVGADLDACPAIDFEIDPLPEAPGELTATVDLMQEVIERQAALVGVTVAELQALDGSETLAAPLLPLLVAQSVVDHPANPNSLRAVAEGTAPALGGTPPSFVDRMLAGISFRESLEAALAAIDAEAAGAPQGPARTDALDCLALTIETASLLNDCMTLANSAAFHMDGALGQAMSDVGTVVGAAGNVNHPGLQVGAFVTGGLIWALQKLQEGTANLLPSHFTGMGLEATPMSFLEDDTVSGEWTVDVRAASRGWELDQAVLEALGQIGGGLGAYDAWLNRFMDTQFAVDLAGFVTGEVVSNAVGASGGAGLIEIPVQSFGPVDISDEEWSDRTLAPDASVAMTSHNGYEPRRRGTSTLVVRSKDGLFGFQQIDDNVELTVQTLQIEIAPDEVVLAPGQETTLTVTVIGSAFPHMVEIDPTTEADLLGSATLILGADSVHTIHYTAPDEPLNEVDLLVVRHTAETGALGHSGEERKETATIRLASFEIATPPECLEVGSPPLQIDLNPPLGGGLELVWSASAGEITQDGLFTPPDEPAQVVIRVALADDPTVFDELTLPVGGCSCQISVSLDGSAGSPTSAQFTLTPSLDEVIVVGWGGMEGSGNIGFGTDPYNPENLPVGATGAFDGQGSGSVGFVGFINPDDLDDPTIPPLMVSVTENDGNVFEGSVSGQVARLGDAETILSFNMTFRIEADPTWSTETVKMCRID